MSKDFPSFMCSQRTYATCVDYWSPKISDDWHDDTVRGRAYADEVIAFIREHRNPTILGHVIKAMIGKGGYTGVEVGFFHRLSDCLIDCVKDQLSSPAELLPYPADM